MANSTRMIIITSDENLIEQFSSNQSTNTRIIDLNDTTQLSSMIKDKDTIDMLLRTDLSTSNTTNDQINKRPCESSDKNRTIKQMKLSKKSADLVCAVCGDRAIGYNYDVPSCASCKTFFYRNAHQSREILQCFTNLGQCSVAHETRRKCPRCRLDRCFMVGMRKDFMLNDEQKQRRKELIEENRKRSTVALTNEPTDDIDQLLMDMVKDGDELFLNQTFSSYEIENILFDPLTSQDSQTIENVRSLLLSTFNIDNNYRCFCVDVSDRTSALLSWSQFAYQVALQFISFFRKIDEFEKLHNDDRFILIKYNLFTLFILSKCYSYRPINDCCSCETNMFAEKHRRFFHLCGDSSYNMRNMYVRAVHNLVEISSQDPVIISLLLIILIFSHGLSMNENQPLLKDPLAVNNAQMNYTKTLWNYLVHKCGESETEKYFTRLISIICQIQTTGRNYREFLRIQYQTPDIANGMAPLMQTVLHIS